MHKVKSSGQYTPNSIEIQVITQWVLHKIPGIKTAIYTLI